MSSFWAQRIGAVAAPAAPAPAPAAPASTTPWWMPQAAPAATPAAPAAPAVPAAPAAPASPVAQTTETGEVHFGDLLHQDTYTTTKAQSAKDNESCPDCGGPNYMRSPQAPNSLKQCFDCGYNPRFLHTTHGASGIGQKNLPIKTARAQTLSENNFNPGKIVGRVG